MKPQTIIRLSSSNFMHIRAVEVLSDGSPIIIGGDNEQGKSSLMRTLSFVLRGKKATPVKPVRDGEEEAEGIVETQDFIFSRVTTGAGCKAVKIKAKDGSVFGKSPDAVVRKMIGDHSLDPEALSRESPEKRLELVKKAVGLDFSAIEEERDETFEQRSNVNRGLREKEAQLKDLTHHKDAPDKEVSVAELSVEKERRQAVNKANDEKRAALVKAREAATEANDTKAALKIQLTAAERLFDEAVAHGKELRTEVDALVDLDADEVHEKIMKSDEVNTQVRGNKARDLLATQVYDLENKSDELSKKITKLDDEKRAMISAAEFPVEGMSIDDGDVLLDGLPFDQASTARRLTAGVALGVLGKSDISIMLIEDGSSLDDTHRDLLLKLAAEAGVQPIMEVVGNPDGCATVLIEDGSEISAEDYAAKVDKRKAAKLAKKVSK